MRRRPKIRFKDDREAADFWAAQDSTPYLRDLREVPVKVSPTLRRRVAERAELKKPVTLRLEPRQIEAAKRVARRKSIPYQTSWQSGGMLLDHPQMGQNYSTRPEKNCARTGPPLETWKDRRHRKVGL